MKNTKAKKTSNKDLKKLKSMSLKELVNAPVKGRQPLGLVRKRKL